MTWSVPVGAAPLELAGVTVTPSPSWPKSAVLRLLVAVVVVAIGVPATTTVARPVTQSAAAVTATTERQRMPPRAQSNT